MPHPVLARPTQARLNQGSPTLHGPPQDRFLAFAFAAADLLVEATSDGTIVFADGAFNVRFRQPASSYVGCSLHTLVAAEDHRALNLVLAAVRQHGRAPPSIVRLADAEGSRMSLSALSIHQSARLYVTFSQPALQTIPRPAPLHSPQVHDRQGTADALHRTPKGAAARLGVLEMQGWAKTGRMLPVRERMALQKEVIAAVHRHATHGVMAGELSAGRSGVLTGGNTALAGDTKEIGEILCGAPLNARTQELVTGVALTDCGLGPARAARALRLALSGFRDGGLESAARVGLGNGLISFIAAADARIEATRAAIEERRFTLQFQPIVALATQQIHHYEALLRPVSTPQLPVGGVQEFVLFAEAAGLSEELDWAVLDTAAAASEAARGASIAVNVSGLSMQSSAFRDRMLDRLARATRAGANLLIELTETADIEDFRGAVASMAGLRAAGIPVCLDDFGAGSSAFRYLREFRVDYVKLDGSYVRRALDNAREHGFLLTMVELANFMGAKTVAETIETEAEARLMQDIGVEFGQGYLFGRPAPLPDPQ